ncbi:hypothetical protein ScalyP_jg2212, partial [Parmales sp. scaly parma]
TETDSDDDHELIFLEIGHDEKIVPLKRGRKSNRLLNLVRFTFSLAILLFPIMLGMDDELNIPNYRLTINDESYKKEITDEIVGRADKLVKELLKTRTLSEIRGSLALFNPDDKLDIVISGGGFR